MNSDKITFIGQVTASISHELNNVLSIVDQVNGLLEDELYAFDSGRKLDPEKLYRIHDKIDLQVLRGISIVKNMNKFAHSSDHSFCDFEIVGLVKSFIDVCQRFAELEHCQLRTDLPGDEITIYSSPLLVQQVIFYKLKSCFKSCNPEAGIDVSIKKADTGVVIQIAYKPDHEKESSDFDKMVDELIPSLKGKIEMVKGEDQAEFFNILLPDSVE